MAEIVTPNEIAKRLAVTGVAFRNWLREQKADGHALVASHEYRTHYRFTGAEADQLAVEFAEQVRGTSATAVAASARSTRMSGTSRAGSAAGALAEWRSDERGVERSRSDVPGHRITVEWMGEEVETLADLLCSRLRAVTIGINPTPKSVTTGHYYQGKYGQTFFRRLCKAGLLPDGDGFEDDRVFAAGIGFTDVVKRPTPHQQGLRSGELEHGRTLLETKLTTLDVPLVIFVFKSAAETLLGRLPPHSYGPVPRRRLGRARVFVMPRPTAASAIESDAIKKLRRALRTAS
ncbi:MAG TPA: uracil-DNA glycosylase family protein [Solirubrobacteraceae bacterium]|nr:uracil-DNA glycosylase family protein [Solirubrobacteraceae bacterium]